VLFNDPKHTEYDFWDLRLLKAYYFTEDFTREGIPIWWDESDRVNFEVKAKVSRSRRALDAKQEQDSKKNVKAHGRYYVPVPKSNDGRPLPTFQEWLEDQRRLEGKKGLVQ